MPECPEVIEVVPGVEYRCELDQAHLRKNGPVTFRKQHIRSVEVADGRWVTIMWPAQPSTPGPIPDQEDDV